MKAEDKHVEILDYSWDTFEEHVMIIYEEINISRFKTIVGVAKGGLPLAVKLANSYKLPLEIIRAESYTNKKKTSLLIRDFDSHNWKGPILLIDDIADSGHTLNHLTELLRKRGFEVETLTLCYKKRSRNIPDNYLIEVPDDIWVHFPWE